MTRAPLCLRTCGSLSSRLFLGVWAAVEASGGWAGEEGPERKAHNQMGGFCRNLPRSRRWSAGFRPGVAKALRCSPRLNQPVHVFALSYSQVDQAPSTIVA